MGISPRHSPDWGKARGRRPHHHHLGCLTSPPPQSLPSPTYLHHNMTAKAFIIPWVFCLCVASTGEVYHSEVSPAEPAVFMYTFSEGETNVIVKVESDTDHCMIVAIQNTEVSLSVTVSVSLFYPCLNKSHLILSHHVSSRFVSSHLTSSHLILSYLTKHIGSSYRSLTQTTAW